MSLGSMTKFIESRGFPVRERNDMPTSALTFEGGAHYRMEITGAEYAENFEVLVKEIDKYNIPIHRLIGTVGGSAKLDFQELKYYAQIGADSKIEVFLNPVPTRAWDTGRQYITPEGYVSGMRLRGQDNLYLWLKEFDRCLEAGIRGFLVVDESLLAMLNDMRSNGVIPADVKFKVSVFAGHGNALGGKFLEGLGADSFNPLADLSLAMLASIRSVTKIPMDVYLSLVEAFGGFQRYLEADEIARICAPVYFKFEPGKNESDIYCTWAEPEHLNHLLKLKMQYARIAKEWCDKSEYNLVFNDFRDDLAIPKP